MTDYDKTWDKKVKDGYYNAGYRAGVQAAYNRANRDGVIADILTLLPASGAVEEVRHFEYISGKTWQQLFNLVLSVLINQGIITEDELKELAKHDT